MKKLVLVTCLLLSALSFAQQNKEVNTAIEQWHKAAADANFDAYFGLMTDDAIFIGTDPTENWGYKDFKAFSKPYFDKGKAWSFSTLERNIFADGSIAWFDELLDTHMGICRGSGVLQKTADGWKIKHYVLSMTIPNDNVSEIKKLKKEFDTKIINEIKGSK